MIKYLLGIDGGGTKTCFRLEDTDEGLIGEVNLEASNPNDVTMERCLAVLGDGINAVCKGLDLTEVSVFAGIAGWASGDNGAKIQAFLESLGFGAVGSGSDFENAVELGRIMAGDEIVVVIAGTGSVACSLHGGERKMVGGLGYLLDSTGSGFFLGREALTCALKELDGMAPETLLLPLCEAKLGMPIKSSIADIYRGGKRFIASFAPLVFEAEKKGDAVAVDILDRNGKGMAELITAALRPFGGRETPVVITGGLCHEYEILNKYIRKYMGDEQMIIYTEEPMVKGCIGRARMQAEVK